MAHAGVTGRRIPPVAMAALFQNLLLPLLVHYLTVMVADSTKSRCDKSSVLTSQHCGRCFLKASIVCPSGLSLKESGTPGCSYNYRSVFSSSLLSRDCTFECYTEIRVPECCPGHWGNDCQACPEVADSPCNNHGICSDGITGNGTCTCQPGFVGTACEDCEEGRYGRTCSSVCSCVHGLCNHGINGDGKCTCFSGYKGLNCDQEIPECAALRCPLGARCIEDAHTRTLACKCLPGYQGGGTQCTPINPCLQKVCHPHAICNFLSPNQHSCTCADGYQGDGHVCLPVDPCQTGSGGCSEQTTVCVYDGPGKSHCDCLEGFENLVPGTGCSLKDICQPSSCDKNADCTTTKPGVVECTCREGYQGDGKTCYSNIMQQLRELNTDPRGVWHDQLTNAITLFESSMSWPLSSLGSFTVFVPTNKGFKGTSVKNLVADQVAARYRAKLHMVAGELTYNTLKKGDIFYTLTGKSAEGIASDEDQSVRIRIHGSRKKGDILKSDIPASNGVIHIINKLMENVPPTVKSEKEENLMKILTHNGKFEKFRNLLERADMTHLLDAPGPYTLFAPTGEALNAMKEGYHDFLLTEQGKPKLLELLRNHIIPSVELEVANIVSTARSVSMANQALNFNVTSNGQILVNGQVILEADIEARNGRLYSIDGVLIPSSIEPVLPHRCDINTFSVVKSSCTRCSRIFTASCPSGVPLINTLLRGCIFRDTILNISIPTMGCSILCNKTVTTEACCKGFYGPDCRPCPGGFSTPCSGHGTCMDGIDGNGTCVCEENFRGSRCQYCFRPDRYGPLCDKACSCIHGQCDNSREGDGSCRPNTCLPGYTGKFCERHAEACGPTMDRCHAHATCIYNEPEVECVCKAGYKGDGITCVEMDPCSSPWRGGCGENEKCVKTGPGIHKCQCLAGWKRDLDDDRCQPINRCLEPDRGGCHANATCIYVGPGQSDCECKSGFRGNGEECEPINQCVRQSTSCHYLASCRYLSAGTWTCVCESGYAGDGQVCYGTVTQELSAITAASEFRNWVLEAGLDRMLSENQNFTLFIPSVSAMQKMTKEDKDFWTSQANLPSIIKYHMVRGVYQLADLQNKSSSLQLTSYLKGELLVSGTNETVISGARFIVSDIAATNGLIHIIDAVLIPDRKLSKSLTDLLDQRPEFSLFKQHLIQYNLTERIENSTAYTVFLPTNDAISEYLKKSGSVSMDVNMTTYHIILSEKLMKGDLQDGARWETMLGFSYEVEVFLRGDGIFVNDVPLNITDVEASRGVIHVLSSVLEIVKNHCDQKKTSFTWGPCMDCYSKMFCSSGTEEVHKRSVCPFHNGKFMSIGCKIMCKKTDTIRRCCSGFFGNRCERCPGPVGQPCYGNGVCSGGTNGTGTCRCNSGFNGTACETCVPGKFGIHCDQVCQCVHGQCRDGLQGTGVCECEVGWRGVTCDTAITQDSCSGRCHTSANCVVRPDGSSECRCALGFEGNGTHCSVVNGCLENNGGCSPKALCKQAQPGRTQCVCGTGYMGDGLVCVEINPCLDGSNGGCDVNSECVHTGPNMTSCICNQGYSGNGKSCKPINPCKTNNGNCHFQATCEMTGPGERNCTCKEGFRGNGLTCKGTLLTEILFNKNLRLFYMLVFIGDLKGPGPFTVFIPTDEAFKKEAEVKDWMERKTTSWIMKNHIVACRTLLPEELRTPKNVTTMTGEVLSITQSQGTVFINNNAKVVSSDDMSMNGIIHMIDTVLMPTNVVPAEQRNSELTLTDVAKDFGHTTFTKLLEDTKVLDLMNDTLHQPVTLFWPTDQAMAALPQEQKDFLYNIQNRDKLTEYLKYHVIRDAMVKANELLYSSNMKTLQGSDLQVNCGGEDNIGELHINNRKCRIVQRDLNFKGGIAHGIDCLLTPPSLGGRCDSLETFEMKGRCQSCTSNLKKSCPAGSKFKEVKRCNLLYTKSRNFGCQAECSMAFWKAKCCPGYFGRDCLGCPGGPESPCMSHGKCDEGHLGNGTCACDPGFQGTACELCVQGHYGSSCQVCNCTEHGSCDEGVSGTGTCFCDQGWTGLHCESQLAVEPVCSPACSPNGVCKENNTCECKPFYEGDGVSCTVIDLCKQQNGGCARGAMCAQKGVKVTCTCPRGHQGDGFVCTPINLCANDDGGGCHEHATCTMTDPGKRKCECKSGYIGDGVDCEVRELPINRCALDNGQCHMDAVCTDLHFEDKMVGVFHLCSTKGRYKLTYQEAQALCKEDGATIATYSQLSYAQEAGFNLCSASWLDKARVAYPTSFPNLKCGFGHVGIVDYGTRINLTETWDVFCYRMKDVSCACKPGYIGDGYSCSGNLLQVLKAEPLFSIFLTQILNYSRNSELGKEFIMHLNNLTIQSTLFVPENDGLENQTLSARDIEYHLSDGTALYFQDLTNGSQIRTKLGPSLRVLGIANFTNPNVLTNMRYINDRFISDWDIPASNGIIHVLQGPLRAPPLQTQQLHVGHQAGIGVGVLVMVLLTALLGFIGYRFYTQQVKPFQFHYFKEGEEEDTTMVAPIPSISNPVYESASSHAGLRIPAAPDEDKHQVVDSGPYDLIQHS
ncbi:stabilin-2 isoform X1 [Paramormyrops kingsleyae]|uniref:stabilin-2 isoform X1 n=1 Tax=Paramormyrops kingsleyae TaxID=1676925 RepID=UPI003B971C86